MEADDETYKDIAWEFLRRAEKRQILQVLQLDKCWVGWPDAYAKYIRSTKTLPNYSTDKWPDANTCIKDIGYSKMLLDHLTEDWPNAYFERDPAEPYFRIIESWP